MSSTEVIGFPIGRYRLRFELQAAGDGAYQGSARRGAFGRGEEHVELSVTLFGGANQHLPNVIYALRQAGENGIGSRRVQYSLVAMEQTTCLDREWWRIYLPDGALTSLSPVAPTIPEPPKSMKVHLLSPLRSSTPGISGAPTRSASPVSSSIYCGAVPC